MNIKNIKQPEGGLLQSREWANVLKSEGKEIVILKKDDGDNLYCVVNSLSLVGKYVYTPRSCAINDKILIQLLEKTKKSHIKWIRVDVCNQKILNTLKNQKIKYAKAPHDMQPKENFIIDISESEDDLLSKMKSKTRYNVRLAQKKEVKIFTTNEKKYIDKFYDLVEQTADRKNVSFHSREHYYKMFEAISDNDIQLFVAEYKDEIIATNIISFYGGVATYLHGATSDKYRNVMAPFLLQWEAIKEAKKKNCQWYDFGGIFSNSQDSGKKGITRFKLGFSPKTKPFKTLGSYDIILSQFNYKLYRLLQKIKK